jgi:hypothetical protein
MFGILDYERENRYTLKKDEKYVQFSRTDLVEKLNWEE